MWNSDPVEPMPLMVRLCIPARTAGGGFSSLADSVAFCLGPHGKQYSSQHIRVNILAPGPTNNEFQTTIEDRMSKMMGIDATAMLNQMIPLGRHADPNEIARSVLFLASDQSSFSTGSVFMADGGWNA